MTQDRQYKKVKTYRTLKVVFYCLGLPLFLFAVFLSAFKFIGNDPFTGTSAFTTELGFFKDIEILFTSPALYGVWIAFALWLVIAIVHIILSNTVKNRRTRMFSMMVVTLVVMMGTMFTMDAVLGAKVDELIKNAPAGVTVEDYKTQLSYYRTVSSNRHSRNMTENLIEQVELLEKVYNVEMEGIDKSGSAGNIGNKPVTYKYVIDDNGNEGVDISFKVNSNTGLPELDYDPKNGNQFLGDGQVTEAVEGKQVIRLAPNGAGELVINGTTYSHYCYIERKSTKGESLYTWYAKDLMPIGTTTGDGTSKAHVMDGIYGEGLYNASGMLSDGWVFSLDNALKILQDYYSAKETVDKFDAAKYVEMYTSAAKRRDDYYNRVIPDENGEYCDPWLSALYNQEVYMTERFSLTRGEIDELIAKVGALLGDNSLFDYLFGSADSLVDGLPSQIGGAIQSFLGSALSDLFKQLNAGLNLSTFGLTGSTLNTVIDILKALTGKQDMIVDDLYLCVSYKANDCFGREQGHLFVALVRGEGNWYGADDSLSTVLVRNEDGAWVYANVDGTEFVPNEKYFDVREVEDIDGVWAYKDGSGEVTLKDFQPEVKYFINAEVEVKQDENGNWVYVDSADAVAEGTTPVEKFFINKEVKYELGNWIYVENSKTVPGSDFAAETKYYDALGNELALSADGDEFLYVGGANIPKVKVSETVTDEDGNETVIEKWVDAVKVPVVKVQETQGEDQPAIEKWVYAGVDGTEFAKFENDKMLSFGSGDKTVDMFGNEIEFRTSICTNPETDVILDIDFDDTLIDEANGTYAFDFDTLSAFLSSGLNNLLDKFNINLSEGTLSTVLGLVKTLGILKEINVNGEVYTGLVISGIQIPLINSSGKVDIDILGILEGLLSTMYTYQSAAIKPVWEFYLDPQYDFDENGDLVLVKNDDYYAQLDYAKYERALYMASIQGGMIGSVLIGDSLGTGAYPSSLGLADLASVQQLITDLSYQPVYFPLYALRDMLALFTGIVILFYFVSFLMAQKEEDFATGKRSVRSRKQKKNAEATVIAEFDALELEDAANGVNAESDVAESAAESRNEEPAVEETAAETNVLFDEAVEEPVKEKKSLFGKKKKEKVEEPADELATDTLDDSAFDEVAEEPVKEKKSKFGKKKKEKAEEAVDELATDTLDDFSFDEVAEEPVKEKKSKFGKKKKEKAEEPVDELATDTLDDFSFDEVAEEPVKEKKGLFGKKKKKDDIDEDTALPVLENSDEEVL